MAKNDIQTVERGGKTYVTETVKSGGRAVGKSAFRLTADLDEDLQVYSPEYIHKALTRMVSTDTKNAVRAKMTATEPTLENVMQALGEGVLTTEEIVKHVNAEDGRTFTSSGRLLLKAKLKLEKPNPNKIHWDVTDRLEQNALPAADETEEDEEVEEAVEEA